MIASSPFRCALATLLVLLATLGCVASAFAMDPVDVDRLTGNFAGVFPRFTTIQGWSGFPVIKSPADPQSLPFELPGQAVVEVGQARALYWDKPAGIIERVSAPYTVKEMAPWREGGKLTQVWATDFDITVAEHLSAADLEYETPKNIPPNQVIRLGDWACWTNPPGRDEEGLFARQGMFTVYVKFSLHVGFLSPHDLYDPPQRFIDVYDDEAIPMPQVSEKERKGIPDDLWAEMRRDETRHGITVVHASRATPQRIRRMRKHYYALITLVDEKFGQILDKLESKGLLEDTIVIYTSDHGDNLFDHGLYYKGELYDTIVHMPLLIRAPDAQGPGRHVEQLASHLDVAQYILEKAGVAADDLDGISLAPTIERGARHPREYAFAEEGATGLRPQPDLLAMIRSRTHKLVYFAGNQSGQLFDLLADPGETINLWGLEAYRDLQSHLTAELLDWLYTNKYKHRNLFVDAR